MVVEENQKASKSTRITRLHHRKPPRTHKAQLRSKVFEGEVEETIGAKLKRAKINKKLRSDQIASKVTRKLMPQKT